MESAENGSELEQAAEGGEESFIDELRRDRDEKAAAASPVLMIDVPDYNGRLAIVFRYPEGGYKRALAAVRKELTGEPDARLTAASDLITSTTACVIGKTATGALVGLSDESPIDLTDLPEPGIRFSKELADLLRIKVPDEVERPGHYIVRCVFSPRGESRGEWDGDIALIGVANRIFAWLNGNRTAAEEQLAGE